MILRFTVPVFQELSSGLGARFRTAFFGMTGERLYRSDDAGKSWGILSVHETIMQSLPYGAGGKSWWVWLIAGGALLTIALLKIKRSATG